MIKLKKVEIQKYKNFNEKQVVEIQDDITTLVGMNESGKSNFLEVLAKFNYFDPKDKNFEYNSTYDYPRSELKKFQRSGEDIKLITCYFNVEDLLLSKIKEDIGAKTFESSNFSWTKGYKDISTIANFEIGFVEFIIYKCSALENKILSQIKEMSKLSEIISYLENIEQVNKDLIEELKKYNIETTWDNPLSFYVWQKWLKPNIPKFWYYDEYFSLPSRINLNLLNTGDSEEESTKTAKALIELADIDTSELISSDDFESFKAELEATSAEISDNLYKYWTTNGGQDNIQFDVDKVERGQNLPTEKYLDIRVFNSRHRMSLPLNKRSKGFNWFFSFFVWFSKIQGDNDSTYILLLDEPGLNLHASAQADLLRFIEDLASEKGYQVIYTTHSPFMVKTDKLERVRTVFDKKGGATISDSIKEKDKNTLFPLQAALGYDIAQNLFISKKNLIIEGVSDLVYLPLISAILNENGRTGLSNEITLVPVGGLDKVASFLSLLNSNGLDIACLLDTPESGSKQRIEDSIKHRLIERGRVKYFDQYLDQSSADLEDIFSKEDYLKIFNLAFKDKYGEIKLSKIKSKNPRILKQLEEDITKSRFNHYLPALELNRHSPKIDFFSEETIVRFENIFKDINQLLK